MFRLVTASQEREAVSYNFISGFKLEA